MKKLLIILLTCGTLYCTHLNHVHAAISTDNYGDIKVSITNPILINETTTKENTNND
jgi:hypothetical protein